jgi:hypothetical protein
MALTKEKLKSLMAAGEFDKYHFIVKWTNPDITASFAAQTISVDLSAYEYVMLTYLLSTTTPRAMPAILAKVSETSQAMMTITTTTNTYRSVTAITTSGVTFTDATLVSTYGASGAPENTRCIPYQIIGMKGVE